MKVLRVFLYAFYEQRTLPAADAIQHVILFSVGVLETTTSYSESSWPSMNIQAEKSPRIMVQDRQTIYLGGRIRPVGWNIKWLCLKGVVREALNRRL